jgi:hypothetical protein
MVKHQQHHQIPSKVGGTDISVPYVLTNGQIANITADTHSKSIIIFLDNLKADGTITITLPRTLIDAKIGGQDSAFVVTDHGNTVAFQESKSDVSRTLTIPFSHPADTDMVMISGTQAIPEFGSLTGIVIVIAIIGIITISTKFRFIQKV